MTENEAIKVINDKYETFFALSTTNDFDMAMATSIQALEEIQEYRAIGTVEEVRMLKDYKELYDVYNLIGTIEEFRNLKYKKNVLPIATITINKEDMQKMVDEKVAQIELDIQEIRAKAIDEFTSKLKNRLIVMQIRELRGKDVCPCAETGEECPYINQDIGCQYCAREHTIKVVDEIAERMKEGVKQ